MEALIKRHLNRMQTVRLDFVRSMMDEIDGDDRLLMIKGQKGVGKTTLMLQRIMQKFGATNTTDVLYTSLDNIYFSTHSLLDFIERFHAQGGKYLFLDEVHKYRGWSLEVKNAYDEFEDMHIVLNGCQQPMWWNTAKLLPTLPSTISTRLRSAGGRRTASRLLALPIASSPQPTRSMCWGTRFPSGFSAFCISKDTRLHFPY